MLKHHALQTVLSDKAGNGEDCKAVVGRSMVSTAGPSQTACEDRDQDLFRLPPMQLPEADKDV